MNLLPILGLALVLGIKHSYDADHLIAVSNILRKVESLKSAAVISVIWAIGHMFTASIITILLFTFKDSLLNSILSHFEIMVGIMLIILGIISLNDALRLHLHLHKHGKIIHKHLHLHKQIEEHNHLKHSHKHMFGIGVIHGLASNDELLILITASLGLTTLASILSAVGVFSIGVVIGMIVFSIIFSFPLIKMHSDKLYKYVSFGSGAISVIYGTLMVIGV